MNENVRLSREKAVGLMAGVNICMRFKTVAVGRLDTHASVSVV